MKLSTRVFLGIVVIVALVLFGLLLASQEVGAQAGAVSWEFEDMPVISEVDGYWTVGDAQHRCYTEPVITVDLGWSVYCESGNVVRVDGAVPPTRPGDDWGSKEAGWDKGWDPDPEPYPYIPEQPVNPYPDPGDGCVGIWRWLGWCE